MGSVHSTLGINTQTLFSNSYYQPYGVDAGSNYPNSTYPLSDFRYAGMFYLPNQRMYLTRYRAYITDGTVDFAGARWLSRDPIAEQGGINLYGYVGGNPVNFRDPLGLNAITGAEEGAAKGAEVGGAIGGNAGAAAGSFIGAAAGAAGSIVGGEAVSDKPKQCENDKPDCHKATSWELKDAEIYDEHAFKKEHGAIPLSRFDICKCKDGSIRIAQVGQCGKTRNFWE